ncbi:MAG: hypothetical protein WDN00_17995 [Limisphaerales bacterium]
MTREPILISDLVVGDVLRPLTDREELDPDFVILRPTASPCSISSTSLTIWRWTSRTSSVAKII